MAIRVWLRQRKGWWVLVAGLALALAALVPMALLSFGPFGDTAFSGDPCSAPEPPPEFRAGAEDARPDLDPTKDPLPSLPAGSVSLPPFNPAKGENRPDLPPGWTWNGNEPQRESGQGGTIIGTGLDGTLHITLLPDEAIVSWDDPDRPQDLPWYDPATDRCR